MGDMNVKFKLSADTTQLQKDLKSASTALSQEMRELGYDSSSSSSKSDSSSSQTSGSTNDAIEKAYKRMDRTNQRKQLDLDAKLIEEINQLRRQIDKQTTLPSTTGGGGSGGGGGSFQPPSLPSNGGGSGSGGGTGGSGGNLASVLGKLATATVALSAMKSVFNYFKSSAALSREGNSLAYKSYGSSLMYDSYKDARKDSEKAGAPYGYNSTEVMTSNQAYAESGGGITDNNWNDMDNILKASKYMGLDASSLGSSMGRASEYGVSTDEYTTLLANTVETLGLTGKENEAQDALDDIIDLLQQQNKIVSDDKVADTLSMWNMLASGNEALSGSQGASMAADLEASVANAGGLALLAAAGGSINSYEDALNAKRQLVTGDTSENLQAIIKQIDSMGIPESMREQVLYSTLSGGGSLLNASAEDFSKMEEYMKHWDEIKEGKWSEGVSDYTNSDTADDYYNERKENYDNAEVSTEEKYEVEKENADKANGDAYNGIADWFKDIYNGLPQWAQQGLGVAGSIVSNPLVQGFAGAKAFSWAKGKWGKGASSAAKGASGASGTTTAYDPVTGETVEINNSDIIDGEFREVTNSADDVVNSADDVAKGATNSVDDAARAAENSVDDVLRGAENSADDVARAATNSIDDATRAATNSVDDVMKAAGNSLDDVANAASNSLDDVAKAATNSADDIVRAASNSADDVVKAAGSAGSGLSKFFGAAGVALSLGIGAYRYSQIEDDPERSGDDFEKSKIVGETGGGIIGGLLGSFAGPLGAIAGGWAGDQLGSEIGESWENGSQNYGTGWAGDWNIFGGIFRKNGTLAHQEYMQANQDAAERAHGGKKPSDFGLPKIFDEYINSQGDINWEGMENALKGNGNKYYTAQMESKYGMTYDELLEWKDSDANKKYQQAAIDQRNYEEETRKTLGAKVVHINKGDDNYDAKLDPGNGGYDIYTGTQEEFKEYLKNMGQVLVGSDYKHGKGAYDNPYYMDEVDSDTQDYIYDKFGESTDATSSNTDATDTNTESIDNLTTEVSEMRKWLEKKGYSGTAVWTDDAVEEKYKEETNQVSTDSSMNNLLYGTKSSSWSYSNMFSKFGPNLFSPKSHATGNDYVPYDNYAALLHKGEMVLTADEADDYRSGASSHASSSQKGQIDLNININGNINGMTTENQAQIVSAIIGQIQSNQNLQGLLSTSFVRTQNY